MTALDNQVTPDVVDMAAGLLRVGMVTPPGMLPTPVYGAVPNPRPSRFVTVRFAGGPGRPDRNPVVDRVGIAVECWADKVEDANDLAQDARAVLMSAQGVVVDGCQVYRAQDLATPAVLPDPLDSGQHRVVFTVIWTVRMRRRR